MEISDYGFLYLTCVFSDILRIINATEVLWQKNCLSVTEYMEQMQLALFSLEVLYVHEDRGIFLQQFLNDFDQTSRLCKDNYLLASQSGNEENLLEDAKK